MNGHSKIPFEILCDIFQLLCDKPISLDVLENSSCFGEFPWAVGQVCKRWRAIFVSYPHLWTSLSLSHHSSDDVGVDCLHEMSRRTLLYLERSERLPLTITLHVSDLSGWIETTWKLLLSCSERWERADLQLFHEAPILDLLRCKMPIVKSLTLYADSNSELYHPFTALPRLTELNLLRWTGEWVFPWSQLTKLNIYSIHREPAIGKTLETILSQLQNIEELRVGHVNTRDRNNDHDQRSIRLASLRLLAVQIYPPEILTRIEAPLLEHLWVDWHSKCPEGGYFTEELSIFIRRSSCHIRRLTLHNYVCQLLPRLMKLLSSVEVLCIIISMSKGGQGSALVKHITRVNDGVYLPNLRELEVTCRRGRDVDDELMTAMSGLLEMRSEESRLISVTRGDMPRGPRMVQISMSFK